VNRNGSGVLRLILELDGETVTEARAGIGYLHTGIEKNLEFRTWTQGVTFVTRMDYLAPIFNETAYCMGVERLLGISDDIPERAQVIRVLTMELCRIASHGVALGTGALELGALTPMIWGFRDRNEVLDMLEKITGLRMNHAYVRPGGVAADLPHGDMLKVDIPGSSGGNRAADVDFSLRKRLPLRSEIPAAVGEGQVFKADVPNPRATGKITANFNKPLQPRHNHLRCFRRLTRQRRVGQPAAGAIEIPGGWLADRLRHVFHEVAIACRERTQTASTSTSPPAQLALMSSA